MILSEKKLAFICVICSLIGLVVLFITSSLTEPLQISIIEASKTCLSTGANGANQNNKAKVLGFVDSVDIRQDYAAVSIASIEPLNAVSFDTAYIRSLNLKQFQQVEAFGELRSYKGRTSFIITKLKPLNSSLRNC